ncbi:hypothetical protein ACSNKN_08385 [Proteus mirabilis]|uniref:hypothetical protein n=1 Tax=Proteus mirabilis TaxID=584 RepID=UPI003F1C2967
MANLLRFGVIDGSSPINCRAWARISSGKTINKLGAFSGRVCLLAVKSPEVARAGVETEIAAPLAARPLIKVLRETVVASSYFTFAFELVVFILFILLCKIKK